MVHRIYVEKKDALRQEAASIKSELCSVLGIANLAGVRLINRYDVELADEADLFAVVPATANFLAKAANGIADDALSTFAATFNGTHIYAPAMNPKMWAHSACRENCAVLEKRGAIFAGPANGSVACGAAGTGRMIEVPEIIEIISKHL